MISKQPGRFSHLSDYCSNLDLPAAAKWLDQGQRITVLTHAKPDGDAWGSVVALTQTLLDAGKQVIAAFVPPVPRSLAALGGHDLTVTLNGDAVLPEADRVVVVDTGAWSQCEPFREYLQPRLDHTLILDHHLTGDIDAARRYVDTTAAATCQIVAQLLDLLSSTALQPQTRSALFVGLATDTGFFRYSNTTPQTMRLAADLIEHGVDHAALYEQLELCERHEKLALTRVALDSLQWVAEGRAAVMVVRRSDFRHTASLDEETEGLVNLPLHVSDVRVSVLLCEQQTDDGIISRLSFRSKATDPTIDVARLAATFGGGGHIRAAGARIASDADTALASVITALEQAFDT